MWLNLFVILIISRVILCNEEPIVNIAGLGQVRGTVGHTAWTGRELYMFRGIRYGMAPVGNLRFKPTVKVDPWDGIKNVTQPGVRCPQITSGYVNVEDEDCLTLSVFTNNLQTSRPVMVFIHGGWLFNGGADVFQPDYLLESDIVLVVIQYRLGPLGFLSTMSDDIPGNVAMLDVITALEWVQQNIASFGGNNSVVTIFGQSAGASAVSAMLHSPLVQDREVPLFHRAILHSGSLLVPRHVADDPLEGAKDIAKRLGCGNESRMENCFREAPIKDLLDAFFDHRAEAIRTHGFTSVAAANLVIGGPSCLFPHHPKHYMQNGKRKEIAIMAGTVSEDGLYLLYEINRIQSDLPRSLNSSQQVLDYIRTLHEKFGQSRLDGALQAYALDTHFSDQDLEELRWENLVTSFADICATHGVKGPVVTEAEALSRTNPGKVYLYSFDYPGAPTQDNAHVLFPYKGVVDHGDDLAYLFPMKKLNDDEVKMAKTMVQLWTSFAIAGVPTAQDVPAWPPMKGLYGPYLKINSICEQGSDYRKEFRATSSKYRSHHDADSSDNTPTTN